MSDDKRRAFCIESYLGKMARLENDVVKLRAQANDVVDSRVQANDVERQLFVYRGLVFKDVCDKIVNGDVSWIPYLYEQLMHGIFGDELLSGVMYSMRASFDIEVTRYIQKELYYRQWQYIEDKEERRIHLVLFLLGAVCLNEQGLKPNGDVFLNIPFGIQYAQKIGVVNRGDVPYETIRADTMKYLPRDGLNYSYYFSLSLTPCEHGYYWVTKWKIARGEDVVILDEQLNGFPELLSDLKKTRRWNLFDYYELVMNRRKVSSLLLCARAKCDECPFFVDAFPLDLLKVVFELAELTLSQEEKEKLRGRAYYHLMEK